jgi:hypothetical protein
VNRTRDRNHGLAVANEFIAFGITNDLTRVGQLCLDSFVPVEIAYILGRADYGGKHRPAQRRGADSLHLDTIAGFVQSRKIIGNLFPIDDRSILARIEPENGFRRRNGVGRSRGRGAALSLNRAG